MIKRMLSKVEPFLGDNLRLFAIILFILFLKWPIYILLVGVLVISAFSWLESH